MFILQFPLRIHHLPSPVKPQLTEVKETAPPSTHLNLSHYQHEKEMEELRVEKKLWMLLEVKGHQKQLAEREGQKSLVAKERDALREQVKI